MFEVLSYTALLIAALVVYRRGRRLLRHLEDPSFPQLHFAKIQADATTLAIGMVVSVLLDASWSGLKLLLVILLTQLGGFPYRKTLFRETWRWPAFLLFQVRFTAMAFGPLILLAALPGLARQAGEHAVPVALGLALVGMLWVHRHPFVSRWLVAGRPIEHPELEQRFAAVAMKADCRPPAVWHFGASGGFFVNAFALPSLYRPGVMITNDLLESFGPRETTAIFAHEVAHLEEATRRKRILGELWHLAQLALAVLFVVWLGPGEPLGDSLQWLWGLGVVMLALRKQRSRDAEHRSDLRGAELCGDPQALIDALRKIHLLSKQPRRWSPEMAAQLTHPSLAQRLRAIREAAIAAGVEGFAAEVTEAGEPSAAAPAIEPCVLVAGQANEVVLVLTDRHFHQLRNVPPGTPLEADALLARAGERKTVAYDELLDLRHEVKGWAKAHRLVAVRAGERADITPIAADDVPRLGRFLVGIEHRLKSTAPGAEAPGGRGQGSWSLRLYGVLLALLALMPFSPTLVLACLAVAVFPGQAALVAAGLLAVASAIESLILDYGGALPEERFLVFDLLFRGGWGLYLAYEAWRRYRRGDVDPPWTPLIVVLPLLGLGILSAVSAASRLSGSFPLYRLHLWSLGGPLLPFVVLALGVVLLTRRRRVLRWLAVPCLLLGPALWWPATSTFLATYGGDPLARRSVGLAGAPAVFFETPTLETERSFEVDDFLLGLEVSPGGQLLLHEAPGHDGYGGGWNGGDVPTWRYRAELGEGHFYEVEALAATLLDEGRLAFLRPASGGLELVVRWLSPSSEGDTVLGLPELVEPTLALSADRRSWRVVGIEEAAEGTEVGSEDDTPRHLVMLSGDFSGRPPQVERWAMVEDESGFGPTHVTPRGALAISTHFDMGPWWLMMFGGTSFGDHTVTRLGRLDTVGVVPDPATVVLTTPQSLECLPAAVDTPRLACLVFMDDRSRLVWIDPGATTVETMVEPVATFEGYVTGWQTQPDGRLVLSSDSSSPLLFDPVAGRFYDLGPGLSGDASQGEGDPAAGEAASSPGRRGKDSGWFDDFIEDWDFPEQPMAVAVSGEWVAAAWYGSGGGTEVKVFRWVEDGMSRD